MLTLMQLMLNFILLQTLAGVCHFLQAYFLLMTFYKSQGFLSG